jgi:hypothetical protein
MADVTALILEDHELLRRRFAALDDVTGVESLSVLWEELAGLLEFHAACEEEVFYPSLLAHRTKDSKDEAEDAIEDHNKIREAIRAADGHPIGSDEWWAAVNNANLENSKHIAEEERDSLPDYRHHVQMTEREELAVSWIRWRLSHQPLHNVDKTDKDADQYIAANS